MCHKAHLPCGIECRRSPLGSEERGEAKRQIGLATRFIMVVAFPCAVGMGVLASPILQMMLFGDSSELAARMLQTGSVSIIFFSCRPFQRSAAGDEPDEGADQECSDCTGASLDHSGGADAWAGSEHFCGDHRKCMLRTDHVYSKCALDPPLQRIPSEVRRTFFVPAVSAAGMGVVVWLVYRLFLYLLRAI